MSRDSLSSLNPRYDVDVQTFHSYEPQIVFLIDVEVDISKLKESVWQTGPEPAPVAQADKGSTLYGASWRSTNFPSTLAPVMYGKGLPKAQIAMEKEPRLHSRWFNFDATAWFNQVVAEVEAENLAHKNLEGRPIESFILERAELQLFDNQGKDRTFGQLAIYATARTRFIGRVQDIFTVLTRTKNSNSTERSRVPGSYLYDLLDSPEVRCSLPEGKIDVFEGIHFYTNTTYLKDTEAKIYSLVHLRVSEKVCQETINYVVDSNSLSPYAGPAWEAILSYLAVNLRLTQIIADTHVRQRNSKRLQAYGPGRYGLLTRLGAAFLTLDQDSLDNQESELYFLAEHVDAVMIARLHDQILRHAEVDLVIGMGNSTEHRTFERISEDVLETYHQFTANSVRYWMDDVTANSGLGITTLRSYKKAIGYQERYDAMRIKIEDIAMLAQQDKQDEIRKEQEEAHLRQVFIENRQQSTFLFLTIFTAIAVPWSMLNDGIDFVHKTLNGDFVFANSLWMLGIFFICIVSGFYFWNSRRIK